VQQVVCSLPAELPAAIVVAQHMPARFTRAFAERLNRLARLRVVEAQDGHRLCAGVVYIAPGAGNLEVEMPEGRARPDTLGVLRVVPPRRTQTPVITPSGDHLFKSFGEAFGERMCGVVLTGMGSDGTQGAAAAKHFGATIYAEDPRRAVMPGMPYSAVEAGVVDRVMSVEQVARAILEFCGWGV
jgi:two-component system chemotaxis response regulator CheB